jgi:hypothetical protein
MLRVPSKEGYIVPVGNVFARVGSMDTLLYKDEIARMSNPRTGQPECRLGVNDAPVQRSRILDAKAPKNQQSQILAEFRRAVRQNAPLMGTEAEMFSKALSSWRKEFKARIDMSNEKDAALLRSLDQMCREIRGLFQADNALKARFEMDYIAACGDTKKGNALLYEVRRVARSSLSVRDRNKLILRLCKGKELDEVEAGFVRKALDFALLAKQAERVKASDLRMLVRLESEPANTAVVQRNVIKVFKNAVVAVSRAAAVLSAFLPLSVSDVLPARAAQQPPAIIRTEKIGSSNVSPAIRGLGVVTSFKASKNEDTATLSEQKSDLQ